MIYLDNGATTGVKPITVIKSAETALREYSANPGRSGHKPSVKASTAVYNTREAVADFFGVSAVENVIFTMNCTHSLNCVIKGVLNKGDHVIVSSLEHNAVMRPLIKSEIDFDVATVSLFDDNLTLREFEKKIKINTKMIICTGASNVLGKILPITEIGNICYSRGIRFAVDAAQTAGVIPINMKKQHIDYLCVAPHKGLYAPMGVGILICEKPIENTLIEGGTGTNSTEMFQPDTMPERMESGTVNVVGICGIKAGVEFVKKIGLPKIYNHEMRLIKSAYKQLSLMTDIVLYTPEPENNNYVPLLSFNVKNVPSAAVAQILGDKGIAVRGGLHCAPSAHRQIGTVESGAVRICPCAFNSQTDINDFIKILKSINIV